MKYLHPWNIIWRQRGLFASVMFVKIRCGTLPSHWAGHDEFRELPGQDDKFRSLEDGQVVGGWGSKLAGLPLQLKVEC